jgi:hypothetical protein
VYGGPSCPTGPFRSYCGTGSSAGSIITYSFAQTRPAPVGPPLQSGSGSTTTPAAGSTATVWSGTYQVNTGVCNLQVCCCPSGTISLAQTGTTVSGTMSLAGQCGGSTTLPFFFNLATATSTTANLQWVTGQPLTVVKNGVTVTMTNGGASQCSSSATCTSGDCLQSGASMTCFHESTLINYKSVVRTLSDFKEGVPYSSHFAIIEWCSH